MPPSELIDLLSENNLKAEGFGLTVEFRQDKDTFEEDLKNLPSYFYCEYAEKTGFNRCVTYTLCLLAIPWITKQISNCTWKGLLL
jgi:hypothetical protein